MSDTNLLNEIQQFKLKVLEENHMAQTKLEQVSITDLAKNVKEVHEEGQSKRFNEGKPKLSYILKYTHVLEAFSRVMELGAYKYGDDNWKLGGKPDGEYIDSMTRHLTAWLKGEKYDPDSGCNHLAHAIWNLCTLLELNHPDDIINNERFQEQCKYWKEKNSE